MSGKYVTFRVALAIGQFSWISDSLAVQLCGDRFSYDEDDDNVQNISGLIGSPILLTNPTVDSGWCGCDKLIFTGLTADEKAIGLVIYRADDGLPLVHHDAIDPLPLPTSPGGTIEIEVPLPGIFRV